MISKALLSSNNDDWETPPGLFAELDRIFHFTLDPCATATDAKCGRFYTREQDGLAQNWRGETVFCNPPYSSDVQDKWVRKCWEEGQKPWTTVVALLPARTDTKRFHEYIAGWARIRFLRGRLKFVGAKDSAPFPSMVVVWGGPEELPGEYWDFRRRL